MKLTEKRIVWMDEIPSAAAALCFTMIRMYPTWSRIFKTETKDTSALSHIYISTHCACRRARSFSTMQMNNQIMRFRQLIFNLDNVFFRKTLIVSMKYNEQIRTCLSPLRIAGWQIQTGEQGILEGPRYKLSAKLCNIDITCGGVI